MSDKTVHERLDNIEAHLSHALGFDVTDPENTPAEPEADKEEETADSSTS